MKVTVSPLPDLYRYLKRPHEAHRPHRSVSFRWKKRSTVYATILSRVVRLWTSKPAVAQVCALSWRCRCCPLAYIRVAILSKTTKPSFPSNMHSKIFVSGGFSILFALAAVASNSTSQPQPSNGIFHSIYSKKKCSNLFIHRCCQHR